MNPKVNLPPLKLDPLFFSKSTSEMDLALFYFLSLPHTLRREII